MRLRRLFTLLLISMLPILAMGQNGTVYPIDLSVMMTPPYGTCLKEYVGSDRIVVQALLKDFSKKSEQFVVQLKVTDNRNRVVLLTHFGGYDFPAGKTFTYPMGPNADQGDKSNVLYQLFANATIQPKNECFEEGAYTFEFQAFQAASYPSRKIALSMPFRYPVFLQGNTVQPLQIYPYENEVICSHAFEYTNENGMKRNATQLNGIAYQWQSANPTGMKVGYLLQVVDLGLIGDKKWKDIKSEAGGIFGKVDKASYRVNEVTYTPFHNHAFSAANYEENHAYAWRVLALVGKDLELGTNASVYNNNAPVRVFYICGAPGLEKDDYEVIKDDREFDKNLHKVKMDTIKSTDLNALALWRDSSVKDDYCGVNVEIRKKGQEKWTPFFVEMTNKYDASIEPTDNSYSFTNLSYNTRYEVRAQYVKCDNCTDRTTGCVYAPYSDPLEFVIAQPIDSATCGSNLPKLADCGEGAKAPKILAGDTIIANGTKVVVDSVSYPNASDSSIITGNGHICMPIVKNIQLKMEFNDIQVNCAKELVKGKIKSIWDERTCAMINIDELTGEGSTGGKDNSASDATLEEYSEEKAKSSPAGTLFVDGKKVKLKTKEGEVVEIGETVELSAQQYQSKNFLSDNSHYIEFYNEDKVNNAFDNDEQGYYRKMSTYEFFDNPNNKVVLPWLANNPGKLKTIKAREVNKKSESAKFESVMFVIPSGSSYIKLDAQQDKDGNYELKIPGWADVDHSTPIYAIARNSAESSYFDAGKMMQANYAERTHKLNIVSLIGDLDASYKTAAEKALNSIYGRVGVSWTVELSKFDNDSIKNDILDDGLAISVDSVSKWKSETREMYTIRTLYSKSISVDKESAYLFVVNHAQEEKYKSNEGDMPRNQSVGYIFNDKVTDANKFGRLVAHEIGHGVYKLQHTFDYKDMQEGTTDNLMDYNDGDFLAHYQWRIMQDSVMFVWSVLQDDEDGMSATSRFCWLGDLFDGWVSDKKESCVEGLLSFFDHIFENSDPGERYYAFSLAKKETNVIKKGYEQWIASYGENNEDILQNIHEQKSFTSNKLKKNHIYVMSKNTNITGLKTMTDMIIYVFQDNVSLSKYKISSFNDMGEKTSRVKCGYRTFWEDDKYALVAFYDEKGNLAFVVQLKDFREKEKLARVWAEYLLISNLSSSIFDNILVSVSVNKTVVDEFWKRKTALFEQLSKAEYDALLKTKTNKTQSFHVEHGKLQALDDTLSASGHKYTIDDIRKIYSEKNSNKPLTECEEKRLTYFYGWNEENLKNIYERGNLSGKYDFKKGFPENCLSQIQSKAGGHETSVSNTDDLENRVKANFYNKKLPKNATLILKEDSKTSELLHYYPYFQKIYYFKYLEYVRKFLLGNNMGLIKSIFEPKYVGLPNFSRSGDIMAYDFYGVFGGTQRAVLDLKVTEFDDFYLVDTNLLIEDWYGADFEDFFGTGTKAVTACMNAFFMLQFCHECSPFKTGIYYRDYNKIYKNK